jgi:hypothetical protein
MHLPGLQFDLRTPVAARMTAAVVPTEASATGTAEATVGQ